MKKSLVIGRFQPFHDGHRQIVQKLLDEGKAPVVAIRDTEFNDKNPYTLYERIKMVKEAFPYGIEIVAIPDIEEVVYGRTPGWTIREIELSDDVEKISATAIRKPKIIWLTGNSGAGKSTLAFNLKKRFPCIILDGDVMRMSISTDKGFSLSDRLEHNLRVARLANVLRQQGHNVVVSVIAPTQKIRQTIKDICDPTWVYVKRDLEYDAERPYETPEHVDIIVDHDKLDEEEAINYLWEKVITLTK